MPSRAVSLGLSPGWLSRRARTCCWSEATGMNYDVTARGHSQHPGGRPAGADKPASVAAKAAAGHVLFGSAKKLKSLMAHRPNSPTL